MRSDGVRQVQFLISFLYFLTELHRIASLLFYRRFSLRDILVEFRGSRSTLTNFRVVRHNVSSLLKYNSTMSVSFLRSFILKFKKLYFASNNDKRNIKVYKLN